METIASFSIEHRAYLDPDGAPLGELPACAGDSELLLNLYRLMVRARLLDQRIIAMQRTGRMGTYASCLGQEAISAGAGLAMQESDVLVPYYRDMAAQLHRGVRARELLLFWGGDERGNCFGDAAVREDLPYCIPIATQVTHAAGVAAAIKLHGEERAVLVTSGDGATSRGEFMESINLAGVWKLPLVILVNNNQWAISERVSFQTAAKTLAQKAIAAGIPGEQLDGNDPLAVYDRVRLALERARSGRGPTLIEAVSYRLGDHTTADDATRYRPKEELSTAWQKEPIRRLRSFLAFRGLWDEAAEKELQSQASRWIESEVAAFEATPAQPPEAMFDFLYAELPRALRPQREALLARRRLRGVSEAEPSGEEDAP